MEGLEEEEVWMEEVQSEHQTQREEVWMDGWMET